jgi:hypothetical protein
VGKLDGIIIYNIMKFSEWQLLKENNSRYSVGVDYNTNIKDILNGFAKISLGYVSAGMKKAGYHVKIVFEKEPFRVLVSSRNWDDGEWVGMVSFNPEVQGGCFIVSKGFYNKDRKTISIQKSQKCNSDSSSEIVKELKSLMNELKNKKDNHQEKLSPVKLKTGPKR